MTYAWGIALGLALVACAMTIATGYWVKKKFLPIYDAKPDAHFKVCTCKKKPNL
jgi:hypothetical protein